MTILPTLKENKNVKNTFYYSHTTVNQKVSEIKGFQLNWQATLKATANVLQWSSKIGKGKKKIQKQKDQRVKRASKQEKVWHVMFQPSHRYKLLLQEHIYPLKCSLIKKKRHRHTFKWLLKDKYRMQRMSRKKMQPICQQYRAFSLPGCWLVNALDTAYFKIDDSLLPL